MAIHNGNRYLPPKIIQIVGLCLLIFSLIFWFLAGRESVLFVSSAITLIGLGSYTDLKHQLDQGLGAGSPSSSEDKGV